MKRNLLVLMIVGLLIFGISSWGVYQAVTGSVSTVSNPIQLAFYATGKSLVDRFSIVFEIASLRTKNSELDQEVSLLQAENALLKKLEEENKLLKDQLGVTLGAEMELKSAQVLGFTPASSRAFVAIDKGGRDQVKSGDILLVKDIILGTVTEVKDHVSTVRLLTDPQSKVLGETTEKVKGVVVGDFGSRIKLTKVLLEEKLEEGQMVITSGEEHLPKGLVIGKITKVKRLEAELFQEAEIEPLLNINKLDLVFIQSLE